MNRTEHYMYTAQTSRLQLSQEQIREETGRVVIEEQRLSKEVHQLEEQVEYIRKVSSFWGWWEKHVDMGRLMSERE